MGQKPGKPKREQDTKVVRTQAVDIRGQEEEYSWTKDVRDNEKDDWGPEEENNLNEGWRRYEPNPPPPYHHHLPNNSYYTKDYEPKKFMSLLDDVFPVGTTLNSLYSFKRDTFSIERDGYNVLPDEILFEVCLYLDHADLLSLILTSKSFSFTASDENLWRRLTLDVYWPSILHNASDCDLLPYNGSWKLFFFNRLHSERNWLRSNLSGGTIRRYGYFNQDKFRSLTSTTDDLLVDKQRLITLIQDKHEGEPISLLHVWSRHNAENQEPAVVYCPEVSNRVAFQNNLCITSATRTGELSLWDLEGPYSIGTLPLTTPQKVKGLQIENAGLLVGTKDGLLNLWDLRLGQPVKTWGTSEDGNMNCFYESSNHVLISKGNQLEEWDLRSAERIGRRSRLSLNERCRGIIFNRNHTFTWSRSTLSYWAGDDCWDLSFPYSSNVTTINQVSIVNDLLIVGDQQNIGVYTITEEYSLRPLKSFHSSDAVGKKFFFDYGYLAFVTSGGQKQIETYDFTNKSTNKSLTSY